MGATEADDRALHLDGKRSCVHLHHVTTPSAIRLVASFEVMKGIVVLVAATGLASLMHRDVEALVIKLVEHTHLNPASRIPQIFVELAGSADSARLRELAMGAAAYAALRLLEGYGLLRGRVWAEVLGATSGAIYIPFEVSSLAVGVTALKLALLLGNIAVVSVMLMALWRRVAAAKQPGAA